MTTRRYSYTTADGKRWLGATQAAMLRELVERGFWHLEAWYWDRYSARNLERTFARLGELGLTHMRLEKVGELKRRYDIKREVWRPTARGRRVARLIEAQDRRERAGQQAGRL